MMNSLSARVNLVCLLVFPLIAVGADSVQDGAFGTAMSYAHERVVKIYGANVGRTPGYSTGIIVSEDGRILTANGTHLNGERIRVVLPDGRSHLATAEKRSRTQQLALLKIEAETPEHFDLERQPAVYQGQWVLSFSNLFKIADGSDPLSMMLGIVALQTKLEAKRGNQPFPYEGDVLLLDTISSNPGAPGGALVAAQSGALLGMIGPNLESRSSGTKLNYAIPVQVLQTFVHGEANATLAASPKVVEGKPYLGLRLFRLGGKQSPAYVDRVLRGSPAAKAKLRPDDAILGIDDERIKSIAQFDEVFAALRPGATVELVVKRGQKLMRFVVTLEAAKKK